MENVFALIVMKFVMLKVRIIKMISKTLIGLGVFAMVFGTSMAEPMSTNVFLMQIGLIFGGLISAIYGGIIRK